MLVTVTVVHGRSSIALVATELRCALHSLCGVPFADPPWARSNVRVLVSCRGIVNMNTADAAGDAFFDMRGLCQVCPPPEWHAPGHLVRLSPSIRLVLGLANDTVVYTPAWSFLEFLRNQWVHDTGSGLKGDGWRHAACGMGWCWLEDGLARFRKAHTIRFTPRCCTQYYQCTINKTGGHAYPGSHGHSHHTHCTPHPSPRFCWRPGRPAPPLESVDLERMAVDAIIAIVPDGHTMPVASP